MVSWIISRLVVLIFGTLYPAYSSYKAVKTKNVKEYVKWMMYWIVFAFFTTAETLTDIVLSWFPFYFELKIAFVIWLLSPYTKGSSVLYRKFVHPTLSNKEKEIDEYITQARDKSYETMMRVGKRGLNLAANAAVTAAAKGQGVLSEKLRSFSMQDLTLIRDEDALPLQGPDSRLRPHPAASWTPSRTWVQAGPSAGHREGQPQGLRARVDSHQTRALLSSPKADDPALSLRSSSSQADPRTEASEDDMGDKAPKRVKPVKKVPKAEVRAQARA
uniref:Receptor expression-enhancing protein n=1 Tax=Canis lupus familiaris TaxID=9615 RepID=A0A8C0SPJ9_CANLF